VLDSLVLETPSTKQAKQLLDRMELGGPVMVVLTEDDANAALSFRNLPRVTVVGPYAYGVSELLRAREVVFSRAAYQRLAGSRKDS
jgi:large subunit ribosomal protein L4